MVLEMVKDALFEALDEKNSEVGSWKHSSQGELENLARVLINRADYHIELSEVLKDPSYQESAFLDFEEAIEVYKFLEVLGSPQASNIEKIEMKLGELKT
jgi:hypothetical protein